MRNKSLALLIISMLLLTACDSIPESLDHTESDNSIKESTSFVSDSGEQLYIGMSRSDCEEVLGIDFDDGWHVRLPLDNSEEPYINVLTANDKVISLDFIGAHGWSTLNGISYGDSIDAIKSILGEPDSGNEQVKGEYRIIEYYSDDSDNVFFTFDNTGCVVSIMAGCAVERDSLKSFGQKVLVGRGKGNAHIDSYLGLFPLALEIEHNGSEGFKVTMHELSSEEIILVDTTGEYKESIAATSASALTGFDVIADGEWSIWYQYYFDTNGV